MTSKFSIDNRELLQRISSGEAVVGIDFGNLIVRELAAFRMAAMDCEPVAENIRIADALEGLLWPNMAIGNKAVIQDAIEALRAYHAQPAPVVPDGYVMVPKEPTDEMIAAAMNCEDVLFNSDDSFCVQFGNIYEAMLAAAPQEGK
ncbi:hypothetical protein LQG02_18825 [Klebsiella quasipneumoniae]|uniref:hypothetical protein n=1 Tax=Klebsiella quasipneumoniae TaxID=1463165 RepID=UPI001FCBFBA5|nr:hypothetical protein [Klebsiella quasipneumoniae]MCJ7325501.1 hypothetical protein [Klebsiella quasipneumoniae]